MPNSYVVFYKTESDYQVVYFNGVACKFFHHNDDYAYTKCKDYTLKLKNDLEFAKKEFPEEFI